MGVGDEVDYAAEMAALDAITPANHPALDGGPWRDLRAALAAQAAADNQLRDAVARARAQGYSWALIGNALGLRRQTVWERYRHRLS